MTLFLSIMIILDRVLLPFESMNQQEHTILKYKSKTLKKFMKSPIIQNIRGLGREIFANLNLKVKQKHSIAKL